MQRLILQRQWYDDDRTIGTIWGDGRLIAYVMEPGRKDSSERVPPGFYFLARHGWEPDTTLRFRRTWALVGATVTHQEGDPGWRPGFRTACVLHVGRRDEHTRGCLLVGLGLDVDRNEPGLVDGPAAMRAIRECMGEADGFLEIRG